MASDITPGESESGETLEQCARPEAVLPECHERFRSAFALAAGGLALTDADGRFVDVNQAFCTITGYTQQELSQRAFPSITHQEDLPGHLALLRQLLAHEIPSFVLELRYIRKNGEIAWGRNSVSLLPEQRGGRASIVVACEDITAHKQVVDEITKQKEVLQKIFDHIPVMINFIDEDNRIKLVNREWERTLGWSLEEILTKQIDIFAECYPNPQHRQRALNFISSSGEWAEFKTSVRDGRVLDTAWAMIHLSDGTSVGIGQDITARKRAEEVLRQNEEKLRHAGKMEAIGQLAGGIAHDFNNLLTVINGYSAFLLEAMAPHDPRRESMEEICAAGERAAALTQQLLAFSRKQILQPRVLDLNALIAETSKMLQRLVGEGIDLVTVLEADPSRVKADPVQMQQVILNLAVNARDAIPRDGTLTIRTANLVSEEPRSSLGLGRGRYVLMAISDTGVGMDAETQSHMFEPFFTTKVPGKGTGLGLATVYGILQQSGGSIEVESSVGQGTTFRIYFPMMEEVAQPVWRSPSEAPPHRPATILLAEDETPVRDLVSRMLAHEGHTVLEASNGQDALRLCEKHPARIDLLLSDVVMPGMSGPELVARVSALRPQIKSLYMSGYADETVIRHGLLEGANVVKKPFTKADLITTIQHVLEGSDAALQGHR